MRLLFTLICCLMLLSVWAQRPANEPAHTAPDFAHLQAAIAGLADTVRLDQLREFNDVMIQAGKFDEAQQALVEAQKVALATHNDYLISGVYFSLGFLAGNQSDYPTALRYYQRAFDLVKNTTHYERQARLLQTIGSTYSMNQDWPNAEHYLKQSLAIAQQHQLLLSSAEAYSNLSNLAGMRNHPAQALAYNEKALAIYQS